MRVYATLWTTGRGTNMKLGVVQFMWGSLRLAPIKLLFIRYVASGQVQIASNLHALSSANE